jgi:FolB domain-containing protein
MDRILIEDLRARCIIGINPSERTGKQQVVVNLALYGDLAAAGKTDRYEQAIDYRAVKKRVLDVVTHSKFFLLEALAEAVAEACLQSPGIRRVRVRVDKPSALRFARSVAVEIVRPAES